MTRDEIEKLTDYQRRCYNAAQEAGILFVKAVRDWRDSIPFASYDGDAYCIGGWVASAFAQKDWDAAFEAFKEGWEEYCQSHKEQGGRK